MVKKENADTDEKGERPWEFDDNEGFPDLRSSLLRREGDVFKSKESFPDSSASMRIGRGALEDFLNHTVALRDVVGEDIELAGFFSSSPDTDYAGHMDIFFGQQVSRDRVVHLQVHSDNYEAIRTKGLVPQAYVHHHHNYFPMPSPDDMSCMTNKGDMPSISIRENIRPEEYTLDKADGSSLSIRFNEGPMKGEYKITLRDADIDSLLQNITGIEKNLSFVRYQQFLITTNRLGRTMKSDSPEPFKDYFAGTSIESIQTGKVNIYPDTRLEIVETPDYQHATKEQIMANLGKAVVYQGRKLSEHPGFPEEVDLDKATVVEPQTAWRSLEFSDDDSDILEGTKPPVAEKGKDTYAIGNISLKESLIDRETAADLIANIRSTPGKKEYGILVYDKNTRKISRGYPSTSSLEELFLNIEKIRHPAINQDTQVVGFFSPSKQKLEQLTYKLLETPEKRVGNIVTKRVDEELYNLKVTEEGDISFSFDSDGHQRYLLKVDDHFKRSEEYGRVTKALEKAYKISTKEIREVYLIHTGQDSADSGLEIAAESEYALGRPTLYVPMEPERKQEISSSSDTRNPGPEIKKKKQSTSGQNQPAPIKTDARNQGSISTGVSRPIRHFRNAAIASILATIAGLATYSTYHQYTDKPASKPSTISEIYETPQTPSAKSTIEDRLRLEGSSVFGRNNDDTNDLFGCTPYSQYFTAPLRPILVAPPSTAKEDTQAERPVLKEGQLPIDLLIPKGQYTFHISYTTNQRHEQGIGNITMDENSHVMTVALNSNLLDDIGKNPDPHMYLMRMLFRKPESSSEYLTHSVFEEIKDGKATFSMDSLIEDFSKENYTSGRYNVQIAVSDISLHQIKKKDESGREEWNIRYLASVAQRNNSLITTYVNDDSLHQAACARNAKEDVPPAVSSLDQTIGYSISPPAQPGPQGRVSSEIKDADGTASAPKHAEYRASYAETVASIPHDEEMHPATGPGIRTGQDKDIQKRLSTFLRDRENLISEDRMLDGILYRMERWGKNLEMYRMRMIEQ